MSWPRAGSTVASRNTRPQPGQASLSLKPGSVQVAALPGVTTWACSPVDGTVVCAVKTSPQRAQWLPSVKPSETHVGGTAASVTTSWPNASSSPARFVRPQCRHVRFVKPASVQVGSVVAEM